MILYVKPGVILDMHRWILEMFDNVYLFNKLCTYIWNTSTFSLFDTFFDYT